MRSENPKAHPPKNPHLRGFRAILVSADSAPPTAYACPSGALPLTPSLKGGEKREGAAAPSTRQGDELAPSPINPSGGWEWFILRLLGAHEAGSAGGL